MNLNFKIATNTLVQIVGRLISAGTTFLVTILVARQFGVEGYGEFTKITAYVALFYLVADFGFNAIVLKQITEKEEEAGRIFRNLLGMRLFGALALIFIALVSLSFLPYNPPFNQGFSSLVKLGIVVVALTILTQALFLTTNVLFQKNLRYDLSVLSSSVGSFVTLALVLLFTSLRTSLLTVVGSYVIGGILMTALALKFARRFLPQIYPAFDFFLWRKIFWLTLPLGATLVFNLVYFRADMIILSFLRANTEVGIYGLAYKFFEFPLAVVTFTMNSFYPILLWRAKEGKEKLRKLVKKLSVLLIIISLLMGLTILLFAPLLTLIRGDFASSILPLRILSLSLPLFFLSALFMWVLIALGKQKLLAVFYGASMLLNIFLNVIFIPHYGYLAAAVTTGITELIVLLLSGLTVMVLLSDPAKVPVEN